MINLSCNHRIIHLHLVSNCKFAILRLKIVVNLLFSFILRYYLFNIVLIYEFVFLDNECKLFKETIQATEKLCSHIYQTFYKISFRPISFYLEQVEKVKFNKETSDRLSPREYITQVILYLFK